MVMSRSNSLSSAVSSVPSTTASYYSCSSDPELEDLAMAMQMRLLDQKKVKDRTSTVLRKTIPKAFVGKDAVTAIQQAMTEEREKTCQQRLMLGEEVPPEEDEDVTREHALDRGRLMASEFGFFKHATNANGILQDTATDCYQFHNNLPSQVRHVKSQHKTYWDKMRLMEKHVECKDRRYMLRVFPDCFVAREAVDVLMQLKLVRSRGEAVHLVRKLNQKVFCCQHVTSEHDFKDEYLFFRFVPKNERMPEPPPKHSCRKPSPNRSFNRRNITLKTPSTSPKRRHKKKGQLFELVGEHKKHSHATQLTETEVSSSVHARGLPNLLDSISILDSTEVINHVSETTNEVVASSQEAPKQQQQQQQQQKVNQKRADDIRSRLANHKQEMMMRKKTTTPAAAAAVASAAVQLPSSSATSVAC